MDKGEQMKEVMDLILAKKIKSAVELFIKKGYKLTDLAEEYEYNDLTKWDLIKFADLVIKEMRDRGWNEI